MVVINTRTHSRRYVRKVVPLFGRLSTRTQLTADNIRMALMYLNSH